MRENRSVAQGDRTADDLGAGAQAGQRFAGRGRVGEGDRRGAARGQNLGHARELGEFGLAVVVDLRAGKEQGADQQPGTGGEADDQHHFVLQRQIAETHLSFSP